MKYLAQLTIPEYGNIQAPSGIPNPSTTSAGNIINWVIGILFVIAVLAAVGFLIWGGIMWIASQGDKEKVGKARGTIIAAIVGLVIVLLAFVIINFIGELLGVAVLQQ